MKVSEFVKLIKKRGFVMKYVFPAIFRPDGNGFHVFFPDIEGAGTCGDDFHDCIKMGEDWLC